MTKAPGTESKSPQLAQVLKKQATQNIAVLDIETAPLLWDKIVETVGGFDPSSVKMGNIKDPVKQAAKIQEAKENYQSDVLASAALKPWTGRVCAVGTQVSGCDWQITSGSEKEMLEFIWDWYLRVSGPHGGCRVAGWNILGFDIPFLRMRSWVNGVKVPASLNQSPRGRYCSYQDIVDLMFLFTGNGEYCKLDIAARALCVGHKSDGEVEGKNFHEYWESGDPQKQSLAEQYLISDIMTTMKIAERIMG